MNKCPRCGSTRMKRSHSRGFKERLLKIFEQRAYRCINCGWRGILHGQATKADNARKYSFNQIFIIILTILISIAGVFYWLLNAE